MEYVIAYNGTSYEMSTVRPVRNWRGSIELLERVLLDARLAQEVSIVDMCRGQEQKQAVEELTARVSAPKPGTSKVK